jgi:hypothetical protein
LKVFVARFNQARCNGKRRKTTNKSQIFLSTSTHKRF